MCIGTAAAQSTEADVANKYNEAADLVNAKDYAGALKALDQAVKIGLEIPEAAATVQEAQKLIPMCHYQLGMAAAQAKSWDTAVTEFTTAAETAELYGNIDINTRAKARLSTVYGVMAADAFNNKDYAKAIEIFSRAYATNNRDTASGLNLAMAYAENGDLENGLKVYSEIAALADVNSKYAEAAATAKEKAAYYLMIKAAAASQAGNNDEVYDLITKALAIDPASAEANMLGLQTATNQKDYDKVISFGQAAVDAQTDPELKASACFLLGAAYQNKENKAKAIEMYRQVTAGPNVATAKAQIAALSK
jgi:tetratricopeptide (TPR) repeat protein